MVAVFIIFLPETALYDRCYGLNGRFHHQLFMMRAAVQPTAQTRPAPGKKTQRMRSL